MVSDLMFWFEKRASTCVCSAGPELQASTRQPTHTETQSACISRQGNDTLDCPRISFEAGRHLRYGNNRNDRTIRHYFRRAGNGVPSRRYQPAISECCPLELALNAPFGGNLGLRTRADFRRPLNIKIQSRLGKVSRTIYFSRDRSKLALTRRTQAATAVE